ncbi:hypothetical protein ACFHYQ_28885 [Sphaerimonospora cavernae]|uniref:Molecular chaperone DnaJ n=1 Tax=Sphaerimonospora cavernae TaxID=1740611 RepID=A0ABV6UDP7_9ACTN
MPTPVPTRVCPNCDGAGSAVVSTPDPKPGAHSLTTVVCPACGGTGTAAR